MSTPNPNPTPTPLPADLNPDALTLEIAARQNLIVCYLEALSQGNADTSPSSPVWEQLRAAMESKRELTEAELRRRNGLPVFIEVISDGTATGTCLLDAVTGRQVEGLVAAAVKCDYEKDRFISVAAEIEVVAVNVRGVVARVLEVDTENPLHRDEYPTELVLRGTTTEDSPDAVPPMEFAAYIPPTTDGAQPETEYTGKPGGNAGIKAIEWAMPGILLDVNPERKFTMRGPEIVLHVYDPESKTFEP